MSMAQEPKLGHDRRRICADSGINFVYVEGHYVKCLVCHRPLREAQQREDRSAASAIFQKIMGGQHG